MTSSGSVIYPGVAGDGSDAGHLDAVVVVVVVK